MRTILRFFAILTVVAFIFLACQKREQFDLEQVRQAIEQANAKFEEAFNQGDAAGVAALYTDDATILAPNTRMIKGKEGIEELLAGFIEMGAKDLALTSVDLQGSGSLAYEIGKYSLSIQPEGEEAMKDSGKYIVVWKRQADGTWKLHADIWNSSMPVPTQ